MAVEIATTLATTVVSQILIPFLKKGAETLKKELIDKAGNQLADSAAQSAVGMAQKVWERVKSAFSSGDDKATLTVFEKNPEKAAPILVDELATKIQADEALAKDLQSITNQNIQGTQSTGATIFGDYGVLLDFRSAQFSGGTTTITGATFGAPPSPSGKPTTDSPKTDQ